MVSNMIETYGGPQELLDYLEPEFLKTRQDALKIRRILRVFLDSHIERDERDGSELPTLIAASHATGIKSIPPYISGVRKEYLRAFQANLAARRQYASVADKISAVAGIGSNQTTPRETSSSLSTESNLSTYISLLKERQRLEKLQIYHHYLDQVMSKEAAQPHFLTSWRTVNGLDLLSTAVPETTASSSGYDLERLTETLERTVLRAQTQLAQEKRLLSDLKSRFNTDANRLDSTVHQDNQAVALQRTKDELIEWIEQQLAKSGGDEGFQDPEKLSKQSFSTEESRRLKSERIKEQYASYVHARKLLLAAISRAAAPISITQDLAQLEAPISKPPASTASSPVVLSSIGQLVQLSDQQTSLSTLNLHLGDTMAEEKMAMVQLLRRLNDESHLIPAHPQPAQGKARAEQLLQSKAIGSKQDEELSIHASAWSHASTMAGLLIQDYVLTRTDEAGISLQDTVSGIANLKQILGQEGVVTEAGDSGEDDIWAAEARGKKQAGDRRMRGPFTGLRGDV